MELPKYKKEPALTSVSGTLSFSNPLPKAPLAILHPRRIFLEMGLFSGFFKAEVSEYIAVKRNERGRKSFTMESPLAAPKSLFISLFMQ